MRDKAIMQKAASENEEEFADQLQDAAILAAKYGYCTAELLAKKIPCTSMEAQRLLDELSGLKIIEDDYSASWRRTYLFDWEAMQRIDEVYHIFPNEPFNYLRPWEY